MSVSPVFIRIAAVEKMTGISRSTVYNKLDPNHDSYDELFPKQVSLSPRAVGWVESEILDWMLARIEKTRGEEN